MDTLPLEILQHIFGLACTDGGYTGCSLSLVSKDIREASRKARFHSVSLIAYPARLDSFVSLYSRECDSALGDTPKVEHLHLVIPPSLGPRRFICGGVIDTPPMALHPNIKPGSPESRSKSQSPPQPVNAVDGVSPAVTGPAASPGSTSPDSRSKTGNQRSSGRSRSPASTSSPVEPVSSSVADSHRTTISAHVRPPGHNAVAVSSNDNSVPLTLTPPSRTPPGDTVTPPHSPNENEPQQIIYSPEYREAAHALARLVAPHLETLVIQRGFRCQIRLLSPALAFIDMPFPRVREIALLGLSDASELVVPHADVGPLFPAATHLHLVRKGLAGHDCMDFWRVHAPRVTHLSVTCVRAPFNKFVPSLANSIGIAHLPDLPPPPGPTYPSLRALVLHQDPPTLADQEHAAILEAYSMLWGSLAHFQKAGTAQGVQTVVMQPFYMHFEEWGVRLREDWQERMVGGPGCWEDFELLMIEQTQSVRVS